MDEDRNAAGGAAEGKSPEAKAPEVKAPKSRPSGRVEVRIEECKGCGYCVEQCPPKVLVLSPAFNRMGYHPAKYIGDGCTGCGICFYACPEPGAIAVFKDKAAV